jgi:hypothetical protein
MTKLKTCHNVAGWGHHVVQVQAAVVPVELEVVVAFVAVLDAESVRFLPVDGVGIDDTVVILSDLGLQMDDLVATDEANARDDPENGTSE